MTDLPGLDDAQLADSAIPDDADPYALFEQWFAIAKQTEPNDPNAMALATASADAAPSVRMVLLKGYGPQESGTGGFTFFTNSESHKGSHILANMQAALLFHWKSQRRQIRIEGPLEQVSAERADSYFHSRPYKSQVGSAASDQSRPLDRRQTYIDRVKALHEQYKEAGQVLRPDHWTGFTLRPRRIEFWQDRANRLHDRRLFTRESQTSTWTNSLLYP